MTAAIWIAGGLLYNRFDPPSAGEPPPGGWPGVTVLWDIPRDEISGA